MAIAVSGHGLYKEIRLGLLVSVCFPELSQCIRVIGKYYQLI